VSSGATAAISNPNNTGNGPSTIKAITLNNQIGTQLTIGDSPSIVPGTAASNSTTTQIISRKLNAPMTNTSNKIIVQSLPINTSTSLATSGVQLSSNATMPPSASLMNTNNTNLNNIFRNFLGTTTSPATVAAVAAQALINSGGTSVGNGNNSFSSTPSASTSNAAEAVKAAATLYNNMINMNNSNMNTTNNINLNNNAGIGAGIGQGVNTITLAPSSSSTPAGLGGIATNNSNATTTITLSASMPSSSSSQVASTSVNSKLISSIQTNNGNSVTNAAAGSSTQSSSNISLLSGPSTSASIGPSKLVINPTSNPLLLQQQQQHRIMTGNLTHPSIIGLTGTNMSASITAGTPLISSGAQLDSATSGNANTSSTFNLNPASGITKTTIPINLKGNTIIPLTVASSTGTAVAASSPINASVSIASSPSNGSSINLKSISSSSATGILNRASQTPPPSMSSISSGISTQQVGTATTAPLISSIQLNGNKPISTFQNLQLINNFVNTISAAAVAASHQQGFTNFNNLVNQINQSQNANSMPASLLQPLQPMRLVANLNATAPLSTAASQNMPEKAIVAGSSASIVSSQSHSASNSSPSSSPLKPNIIRKSRFAINFFSFEN
jgi:trimeric autotransporter adhesin